MTRAHFLLLSCILLGFLLQSSLAWNIPEIPLLHDDRGLYLQTESFSLFHNNFKETKLLLGLSHSQLIMTYSCLFFLPHYCYEYNEESRCPQRGDPETTVNHHLFSAETFAYSMEIYVNNTLWFHNKEVVLATECDSRFSLYGDGREGVLGMGTRNNFSNQTFSIFLNKNLTEGKLLFSFNSSMAKPNPPLNFNATSNWQIPVGEGTLKLGSAVQYFTGNLMFDPHTDAIALPYRLYSMFVDSFKKAHGVDCWGSGGSHTETCHYSGDITKLQPLILVINGQTIEIPAQVYVKRDKYRNDAIVLNVRASNPSLLQESYVNPVFGDLVILDSNVMGHFYAVFNQNRDQHMIQLYVANNGIPEQTLYEKIKDIWNSWW